MSWNVALDRWRGSPQRQTPRDPPSSLHPAVLQAPALRFLVLCLKNECQEAALLLSLYREVSKLGEGGPFTTRPTLQTPPFIFSLPAVFFVFPMDWIQERLSPNIQCSCPSADRPPGCLSLPVSVHSLHLCGNLTCLRVKLWK